MEEHFALLDVIRGRGKTDLTTFEPLRSGLAVPALSTRRHRPQKQTPPPPLAGTIRAPRRLADKPVFLPSFQCDGTMDRDKPAVILGACPDPVIPHCRSSLWHGLAGGWNAWGTHAPVTAEAD